MSQSTQKQQPVALDSNLTDEFSDDADVKIVVKEDETEFTVVDGVKPIGDEFFKVDNTLYTTLAWMDPDAKYTDSYQNGNWDGYHRLYNKRTHSAPVGLLERAVRALESELDATVEVKRESPDAPSIDTEWNFSSTLRTYQAKAINQAQSNNGGIISIPTGGGKTIVALKLLNIIEKKSIIFVHTRQLLSQWEDRIQSILGIDPGVIGGDQWTEGEITVASMQKVHSQGAENLDSDYGAAVFDECHVTSAADTMQDIGLSINVEWRFGLSATPWRANAGEELEIEAAVGGVSSQVTPQELIDKGHLAKPTYQFITGDFRTPSQNSTYHEVVKRCIELAPTRNGAIAQKAKSLAEKGNSVLVPVDRINQGRLIAHSLLGSSEDTIKDDLIDKDADDGEEIMMKMQAAEELPKINAADDIKFSYIDSSASNETKEHHYDALEDGKLDILITTLIKEGADIPNISAIVHAEGGKSKTQRIQRIGRALRPQNGDEAIVVDVQDQGQYIGSHFSERISALNEYYGKYGPTQTSENTVTPLTSSTS